MPDKIYRQFIPLTSVNYTGGQLVPNGTNINININDIPGVIDDFILKLDFRGSPRGTTIGAGSNIGKQWEQQFFYGRLWVRENTTYINTWLFRDFLFGDTGIAQTVNGDYIENYDHVSVRESSNFWVYYFGFKRGNGIGLGNYGLNPPLINLLINIEFWPVWQAPAGGGTGGIAGMEGNFDNSMTDGLLFPFDTLQYTFYVKH